MPAGNLQNFSWICLAFFMLAGGKATAGAPDSSLAKMEAEQMALFQKVSKAVVFLSNEHGFGSGFFVSENGLILTNRHVVGKAVSVKVVLQDGRKLTGNVVDRGEKADLATVKVKLSNTPYLKESRVDPLEIGMFVASVGHGRGAIWTFNTGLVSNIYPQGAGQGIFQTQIPLNPGSSGGPVVDRHGEVVGIVTAGLSESNSINFAVRYRSALTTLPSLAEICDCLIITTPGPEPVFVDGQMVGKGPRLGIRPTPGRHEVFAVIGGKMKKIKIRYPERRLVELK
jgi:S1-C subfamily serine protease